MKLTQRSLLKILCACLLSACGRKDPIKEPSAPGELTELRAGIIPVAECALLGDIEVFRRHGISLKLTKAASGTQVSDGVVGGGLDFGFSNLVTPIIAESRGIPLQIIGPISVESETRSRHGLIVRKGGSVSTVADLKGKMIGLNAFKNIDHLMVLRWLRGKGVDPASVRLQSTPFPTMIPALDNQGVDGVALVEPFITQVMDKADKFASLGNYYATTGDKPTAVSGFVARKDWLKQNPAAARRLVAALTEAAENARKDEAAFRRRVVEMTGSAEAVVAKMPLPWYEAQGYGELVDELAKAAFEEQFTESKVDGKSLVFEPAKE